MNICFIQASLNLVNEQHSFLEKKETLHLIVINVCCQCGLQLQVMFKLYVGYIYRQINYQKKNAFVVFCLLYFPVFDLHLPVIQYVENPLMFARNINLFMGVVLSTLLISFHLGMLLAHIQSHLNALTVTPIIKDLNLCGQYSDVPKHINQPYITSFFLQLHHHGRISYSCFTYNKDIQ